jgi:nitrogen fixation NifU-like protein
MAAGYVSYSSEVRKHYASPRNVGAVPEPSGKGLVRNAADSDTVLVTLRIEEGRIADIKFKCMGCPVAIASSSMATGMVAGKSVDEAYQLTRQSVADALGGLPEFKMTCSNLAPDAIRAAIDDWRSRSGIIQNAGGR